MAESFFQEHTPDPEWLIRWASSEAAPLIGPHLFPVYQWEEIIYWVKSTESPPPPHWEGNWILLECKSEALLTFWQKYYANLFTFISQTEPLKPISSSPPEEEDLKLETRLYRTVIMEPQTNQAAHDVSTHHPLPSLDNQPKQQSNPPPCATAAYFNNSQSPQKSVSTDPFAAKRLFIDELAQIQESPEKKPISAEWPEGLEGTSPSSAFSPAASTDLLPEGLEQAESLLSSSPPSTSFPAASTDLLPEGLEQAEPLLSSSPSFFSEPTNLASLSASAPSNQYAQNSDTQSLSLELPPQYDGWGLMEWKDGYYHLTFSSEPEWQAMHISVNDPSPIRVISKTKQAYHGSLYPNGVLKVWFENGLNMKGIPRCMTALPIQIKQEQVTKILFAWSDQDIRGLLHLEQFTQSVAQAIGDQSVLFHLNALSNQLAKVS